MMSRNRRVTSLIRKQLLLPIGVVLFLVGIGLTFYNATTQEWHIGEGTDLLDDKTWVIRDQSIGFAIPWSYDLGILPEGTRLWARFNVTTVETRVGVSRPGLSRHTITDVETGEVCSRLMLSRLFPNRSSRLQVQVITSTQCCP